MSRTSKGGVLAYADKYRILNFLFFIFFNDVNSRFMILLDSVGSSQAWDPQ